MTTAMDFGTGRDQAHWGVSPWHLTERSKSSTRPFLFGDCAALSDRGAPAWHSWQAPLPRRSFAGVVRFALAAQPKGRAAQLESRRCLVLVSKLVPAAGTDRLS